MKLLPLAGYAGLAAAAAYDSQIPLHGEPGHAAPAGTSAKGKIVDSKELQDTIRPENLMERARKLYAIAKLSEDEHNHPTRVIGSAGHNGTLAYIHAVLAELGDYYTVSSQPFPAVSGGIYESRLVIGQEVPASATPMGLTPPTKGREPVFGKFSLVANNGCQASDFPHAVEGSIALIRRGECPFGDKSALAGKAGAIAAVIYNNEPGSMSGTLGTPQPDHVATFGLSKEEAEPYVAELEQGKHLDGIAYIDSVVNTITTNNVLAQTKGGDPENCVMLGGHSDSVGEGPGINDDGSGTISLLEVATQLAKFEVNNCVRFAWWSAEEEGLLGSDYYVAQLPAEENLKIRLFMDYDMMASPNFAYQIYNATNAVNPVGSEELRDLYVNWYEEQGLNYTFIPFDGRSDYDGFIRNGIPGGGIATGAEGVKTDEEVGLFGGKAGDWYDPCYHQLCDDLGNVNMTAWEVNTKLIAHSVATYAKSFDGFPTRTPSEVSMLSESRAYTPKYHGNRLVM
ncbi:probable APE3 - vacuolar aminopeptidase Y [Cephalotrichum gorgonifer]|uniref:Peptide hydrolase n=1 Tax=Cephalotrichum gorgonifer TaxID=2041049 RepID=A0AAE8SXW2_9PEZI|nr:probable APE3 - vacuolar aminopeptidase Y [Cephalotrichum gorgonifer]